ncbi:MAG: T9SS type A sorting domain-containing protein [Ignavibacteriae bacterium]|nr:T9SS type A sorting domain-containing protein [Ignavibacteriota bacterium]
MSISTIFRKMILLVIVLMYGTSVLAQLPQNPILFVTQVPIVSDSLAVASVFSNHSGATYSAPRGGDLMIRYSDGSFKNLTQSAGYGNSGSQGSNSIAVREPTVHWSGTKAVFSMVVGSSSSQTDNTQYYWQIYEITGILSGQTPVISKIPNQPANYNNISPIYGTDERIIFTSDRPRNGAPHLYPQLDEYKLEATVTGLWSLDPVSGDLLLMDHNPSGDFTPFLDSYGRVLTSRWDHLQRDGIADGDFNGKTNRGTFNYSDESASAQQLFNDRTEIFPEPQGQRPDLLNGTNMIGMEFNIFLPWQMNEDGTQLESINHIGRHELRFAIGRNINDDPNVVNMVHNTSGRTNQNILQNLMQVREDPNVPGKYYFVDCEQNGAHAAGQICTLTAQPNLDPDQMTVTYLTDRSTANITRPPNNPSPNHTGLYRNPIGTTDNKLLCSHSPYTFTDQNIGTLSNPVSKYDFRVKTLKKSGNYYVPDMMLTSGITKNVSWWTPQGQLNFNGTLWEMYPQEVVARNKPNRRISSIPSIEKSVFNEENVDEKKFRNYLKKNNLALIISRDVTNRDKTDHQQPFFLKIAGTTKQTPNSTGKVYDIAHFSIYQGDQIRGLGKTSASATPEAGRRVLAQRMHDVSIANPPNTGVPQGNTKLGQDGSMASIVPAHRAVTWAIADPAGNAVVRERYWLTFPAGEIRVCASCHGSNDDATTHLSPIPQNKPEALRTLLQYWKTQNTPAAPAHIAPANAAKGSPNDGQLEWNTVANATGYHAQLSTKSDFSVVTQDYPSLTVNHVDFTNLNGGTTYYWHVAASNENGDGIYSQSWSFETAGNIQLPQSPLLFLPLDNAKNIPVNPLLQWSVATGAVTYNLQVSSTADFTSPIVGLTGLTSTSQISSNLANSQTYLWRVQSVNTAGTSAWSAAWQFTTVVAQNPLMAPTLTVPVNNSKAQSVSPTISWQTVVGASGYEIQYSTDAAFTTPFTKTSVLSQLNIQDLANNKEYYWKVRATANSQAGPWSDSWKFLTIIGTPILTLPTDNAVSIPIDGAIEWNPVDGATSYRIQISTKSDFSDTVVSLNNGSAANKYSYKGLQYSTKYYWKIRASSNTGNGPSNFSAVRSFTTQAATGVNEGDDINNSGLELSIHPNPVVNDLSIISYSLNQNSNVTLQITDELGRTLSTLVNEHKNAGGYSIQLTRETGGLGLSTGVYYVKLSAGGASITKQIVVAR